jgi:hypothetical protein
MQEQYCAKLSLGALAYNNKWFRGETKNPWNLKQDQAIIQDQLLQ